MAALFNEFLQMLNRCHEGIMKTVDELPPEALDWSPAPEANSITVLVFHVSGSERFWVGDVGMSESSNRDREAEFRAQGADRSALQRRLDDSLAYVRGAVERLTLEDLDTERRTPDGRTVTLAYCLLHTLEHAMEHLGHIQLTGQLWKQASAGK